MKRTTHYNWVKASLLGLSALLCTSASINAQTSFSCDGTMYLVNYTTLYAYGADGTMTELFDIGQVNALGFSKTGIMWGYDKVQGTIVQIGADGTVLPMTVPGLPANNDFNVGTVDTNGYYYIYNGQATARFYVIDTDPSRPDTYGKLVDPSGGTVPYPEDNRSPKGTVISPTGSNGSNRRKFADWTINPLDGMLYTITSAAGNAIQPYRVVKYDPTSGSITTVAGPISGGGIQGNTNFGAVFMDKTGNFWAFGNTDGHLYSIDLTTGTATKISSTSVINNTQITNIDGASCPNSNAQLPISLYGFDASVVNNTAILKWSTMKEVENAGFEIQRSADGKAWSNIGFVATKAENGNSSTNIDYLFADIRPAMGINMYRLKQIDKDGTATYSAIKTLRLQEGNSIAIAPNPVRDYLSIQNISLNSTVNVYDMVGKLVYSVKASDAHLHLDMRQLLSGLYLIKVKDTQGATQSFKVVKQ